MLRKNKNGLLISIFFQLLTVLTVAGPKEIPDSALFKLVNKVYEQPAFRKSLNIREYALLKDFYDKNRYIMQWYGSWAHKSKRLTLAATLSNAENYLLSPADYPIAFISNANDPATGYDTLVAELRFTDAALRMMHDIAYANDPPYLKYNGLNYHPGCIELNALLSAALADGDFEKYFTAIEPINIKYRVLKSAFIRLRLVTREKDFAEIRIINKELKLTNILLVKKLKQLGYMTDTDTTQDKLDTALGKLQKEHNLPVKSMLSANTLQVLNEPLEEKLAELKWNIRWYRWFNCMQNMSYVLVNIPANRLTFFENGNEKLTSKMVVGKISTPSPTLTSTITQVIYYPYWNVPFDIAVKEMLPALKRNPYYLDKLQIEVLSAGKALPSSADVNWQNYSSSNFPFALRQKPGCKNALGRLKFNFENPFSVYLHDTDARNRFLASRRFFSHGCMRVEKPYELALALGVPPEKIKMDKCLTEMKPEAINLLKPVPVFVIYATIDLEEGELRWYEDAYHKRENK